MKKLIITVPQDSNQPISIETDGFSGPACVDATAAIEQALGVSLDTELKSEYYAKESEAVVTTGG